MTVNRNKIKYVPYVTVDGIWTYKDSDVAKWHERIWSDKSASKVFATGAFIRPVDFIAAMKSDRNYMYVCLYDEEPVGICWATEVKQTSCRVHLVFFKEVWGTDIPLEGSREFFRHLLYDMGFEVIIGITLSSNLHSRRLGKRVGSVVVGEIPHLFWDAEQEKSVPGQIICVTKETLKE